MTRQKGDPMADNQQSNPIIIQFPVERVCLPKDVPNRDELATMIRKVLSTEELFKMNAPKSRKKKFNVEVIDFHTPYRALQDNG